MRGNGFPGLRGHVGHLKDRITPCLEPIFDEIWGPDFSFDHLREDQHSFGLVSSEKQPNRRWLDSQRLPHNDIAWGEQGRPVRRDGNKVATCFATVLGLTDRHDETGTSIWRSNGTNRDPGEKLSLLSTLELNEVAQGSMNPWRPEVYVPPMGLIEGLGAVFGVGLTPVLMMV